MTALNKDFITKIANVTPQKKEITYWDDRLSGFGLRVQGYSMTWVIMYRNSYGKLKKYTLGKINKISVAEARKKAEQILADIKLNNADPVSNKNELKRALTVGELCNLYLAEGEDNKKPSTVMNDRSRINRHIKPLIGELPVKSINRGTIEKLILDIQNGKTAVVEKSSKKRGLANVRGGRSIAKRTIEMLGSIFSFALRRGIISENPVIGVPKPKTNKRDDFLTLKDFTNLGKALEAARLLKYNTIATNAILLLSLTGCRKNEILSLKWEYVDFENQCFRFPDTKTGKQNRAFGVAALNLLNKLRTTSSSEWVFPASRGDGCFIGLLKVFNKICSLHPLKEVSEGCYEQDFNQPSIIGKNICIHTLRHSFASVAADMGYIELTIAGLLGHKLGGVTNRYSHNVDSSLINAADKISLKIDGAIKGINTQEAKIIEFSKIV